MCWVGVSASPQSPGRAHVSLIPSVCIPLPPWPSRRRVGGVERRRREREQQKKKKKSRAWCVRRSAFGAMTGEVTQAQEKRITICFCPPAVVVARIVWARKSSPEYLRSPSSPENRVRPFAREGRAVRRGRVLQRDLSRLERLSPLKYLDHPAGGNKQVCF